MGCVPARIACTRNPRHVKCTLPLTAPQRRKDACAELATPCGAVWIRCLNLGHGNDSNDRLACWGRGCRRRHAPTPRASAAQPKPAGPSTRFQMRPFAPVCDRVVALALSIPALSPPLLQAAVELNYSKTIEFFIDKTEDGPRGCEGAWTDVVHRVSTRLEVEALSCSLSLSRSAPYTKMCV